MEKGKRLPDTPSPGHYWSLADNMQIAGDSWGASENPLVFLLHGGGQTRHAWKNTGVTLAENGFYAVALDARGHGDSDWSPTGTYNQDVMVNDLADVSNQIGKDIFAIVGASMGGGTGLVATGEEKLSIGSLVLVDIAPQIEPEGVKRIGDFMRAKPEGFNSLEEVADLISNYQPHRAKPKDLSGLAKNLRLSSNGKFKWHWDPRFMDMRRNLDERVNRLTSCAKNIDVPTLLVRGGLSDVLSEQGAQDFLKICPHAEYVNVTDAAHMVAGDRNDIFAKSVIEFLKRVSARSTK